MKHGWIKKALALLVLGALTLSLTAFAAEETEAELAAGALEPQVDEQELLLGEAIEAAPEQSAEAADVSAPELPDEAALEEVPQPKAATLTLAAKKVTLGVSEKFSLKPKGSAAKSVKFTTSNGKVAKVSSKGVVTAKKVGKATIKAQVKGKTVAKCVVTVKKKPGKLTLSKSKATLKAGKKLTLKAKLPSGTASHKITWKSSKTGVATVSSKGVVTAKKAGSATITAKTYNGKTAKCKLTVKAGTIKVTLDKQELLLLSGETWQLSATPTSDTALTWASDDEAVAKVSKKGLVTAVGPGSAKITVTTSTGHSASCAVTVTFEPYKIAIMTGSDAQGEEENYAAKALAAKYPDKVVLDFYPDNFYDDVGTTVSRLTALAKDPEVKAVIFVQAVDGAVEAFNRIKGDMGRDDILLIAGVPAEAPADISAAADIVLANDEIGAGRQVGSIAANWHCDVLVHYSFPRHLSMSTIVAKRDAMKATAEGYGIEFVERDCPDPVGDFGIDGARAYIMQDIPSVMEEYAGRKVCFYCTNCGLQVALQRAIVGEPNAYYALPCCPSPYHGFQEAFGLSASYGDANGALRGVANYLKSYNALNRFSTWSLPVNMSMINAGFEYACAYAEGRTGGKLDLDALNRCFSSATGSKISLGAFTDATGKSYSNFRLITLEPISFADYAG